MADRRMRRPLPVVFPLRCLESVEEEWWRLERRERDGESWTG